MPLSFVGAGSPAKNATRCMAPAKPVFAGEPAPTGAALPEQFALPVNFRSTKWVSLTGNTGSSCWWSWSWCLAPRS
ncbi:hypothetical protein BL240_26235 [Pseudomonas putida]|uniref:Uncharacterized protein n=1 Tax=Pseudomonas putida TaxID=303 RepID=A0A1L5PX60_PSEPU|nr:hypothetical protein BL240_26235 [Pseudomonas putida]